MSIVGIQVSLDKQRRGLFCAHSQEAIYSIPLSGLVLSAGPQHQEVIQRNGEEQGGRGFPALRDQATVAHWQGQERGGRVERCSILKMQQFVCLSVLLLPNIPHSAFFTKLSKNGTVCPHSHEAAAHT